MRSLTRVSSHKGLEAGAVAFLYKPFQEEVLLDAIDATLCGQWRARTAIAAD
jgi:FixJ family two-component response regulator